MPQSEFREMSLGEHLEELRRRIIYALIFWGLAIVACLFFQDPLMRVAVWPHTKTMQRVLASQGPSQQLRTLQKWQRKLQNNPPLAKGEKVHHQALLAVLRYLEHQEQQIRKSALKLKILKYQSGFLAYLKVCFIVGLLLGAPFALYQIWLFVAEGLYEHEKKYLRIFAPFSYIAFFCGVAFGYFILIPLALYYLSTYADPEIAENFISLDWYLSLLFALTFVIGLVFELPLVMIFLNQLGILGFEEYWNYWRYWLLLAVISGALLTPPDPFTQMLLAIPIVSLYGVGLVFVYFFDKKKQHQGDEADGEEDWLDL